MPMDTNVQFKVMDLTVGSHQFLYYPFECPEQKKSKPGEKKKNNNPKKDKRNGQAEEG